MQFKWFHVREFLSVRDPGTCLVGKNEAGKSALLKALYRLNPVLPTAGNFDVTIDYPSMEVEDYRNDVEVGKREPAIPIQAGYRLDKPTIQRPSLTSSRRLIFQNTSATPFLE